MPVRRLRLHAVGVLAMLMCATHVAADPPRQSRSATDEVRWHLDLVSATAQSPAFRALAPAERRDEVRRLTTGLFNWSDMSRRALGAEWRERSAAERRGFAKSFGELCEGIYLTQADQISERGFRKDAVRFLGESTKGAETTVRTVLVYPRELPIDFVMSRPAGRWQVHDVVIDGVSVTDNYAAQFRRVMANDSFNGLVDRMTARTSGAASR